MAVFLLVFPKPPKMGNQNTTSPAKWRCSLESHQKLGTEKNNEQNGGFPLKATKVSGNCQKKQHRLHL